LGGGGGGVCRSTDGKVGGKKDKQTMGEEGWGGGGGGWGGVGGVCGGGRVLPLWAGRGVCGGSFGEVGGATRSGTDGPLLVCHESGGLAAKDIN